MFTLIALGVGAAYGYSGWPRCFPASFPRSFRHHGEVAVYFEAAAMITVLVLLGPGAGTAGPAAHGQRNPRADVASRRRRPGSSATAARTRCRWRRSDRATSCVFGPARRSPWMETIVEGRSTVDESMITGEPMPVEKIAGRRGHRRHGQPDGLVSDAGRAGRPGDGAGADRRHGGRGPAEPRPDPAGGRRGRRATSCRPSCWSRRSPSRSGLAWAPSRGWPTPWSTPWPC